MSVSERVGHEIHRLAEVEVSNQRSASFFSGKSGDWCTPADEKKLVAMGYEVGEDGAVNRKLPGRWQFIWAPHYFSDTWLEQRGYRRGFLADWGLSGEQLANGEALVFDDPIAAAIYLEVQATIRI